MIELRLLKYFLAVADEGSFVKASKVLYITQPTLSRQIKELETMLGTELFNRENNLELTEDGVLLKDRALEIMKLSNNLEEEFKNNDTSAIKGTIRFGCIEGAGSEIFSDLVSGFHKKYPLVTYDIFTGTGDDITDRIEKGTIDLGIVLEPILLKKYNTISLNKPERWGILINTNHPFSNLESIKPKNLIKQDLFIPGREPILNRIINWFKIPIEDLNVVGRYRLISNVSLLVEKNVGIAISTENAALQNKSVQTKFIPFIPSDYSDSILVWKKGRILNNHVKKFIEYSFEELM